MTIESLAKIDLDLLLVLHVLLEERSVSAAAARLGRHPSTVSHALQRARDQLGDALLVRAGQEMVPSPSALSMAPLLAEALGALSRAIARPGEIDPSTERRTFRLLISDYAQSVLMPPLVARVRAQAPNVTLHVRPLSAGFPSLLRSGEADLALAGNLPDASDLHSRMMFQDTFVCAMDEGHPIARGTLDLDAFCSHPHALVAPQGGEKGRVDERLAEVGRSRRVALVLPHFLALPLVLRGSDLIASFPTRIVGQIDMAGLTVRPMPIEGVSVSIRLLWHARVHGDPLHRWLREICAASVPA